MLTVMLGLPAPALADITADLIDSPFSTSSAAAGGIYDSASISVFINPSRTNWMALSIGTNLTSGLPNLSGIPTIQSPQSDDAILLTATIGSNVSSQIVLDDNDGFNRRVGNQAVFHGSFNSVGSFNGFTTATYGGNPEIGALTAFFNTHGAGTYTLSVSFLNRFSSTAGHSNVYLLRDVNPIPEPQTYALMLAGLGILGFIARRRARGHAAAP